MVVGVRAVAVVVVRASWQSAGVRSAGVIIWLLSLRFKLALGLSFKTWLIWC
jgi:hypothetical protein